MSLSRASYPVRGKFASLFGSQSFHLGAVVPNEVNEWLAPSRCIMDCTAWTMADWTLTQDICTPFWKASIILEDLVER
jgi:hypothetical protein